jgi:hypothetical protein
MKQRKEFSNMTLQVKMNLTQIEQFTLNELILDAEMQYAFSQNNHK